VSYNGYAALFMLCSVSKALAFDTEWGRPHSQILYYDTQKAPYD